MKRNNLTSIVALLVSAATVAALTSCADSGGSPPIDSTNVSSGFVGEQSDGGEPVPGGTLSFATYGVGTLDPSDRQDGGMTGGTELSAIYDPLMRYDVETSEYQPQLAESLTNNEDNTVWTLKLRDGATFSDGTPVNSAAVQWSINHYLKKQGTHTQVWRATVADIAAPDASTVVFTLQQPWNEFPILFTTGPGMIIAPSSMSTGTFTPVGAGPFAVEKFAPQDELVLAANPTYWGGRPYLDKVRFPMISSDQAKLDTLRANGIQAALLAAEEVVHSALESGSAGYVYTTSMGGVLAINNREGRATSDVRVRKAIAAAINPELVDQRSGAGYGMPGTDMFQDWSQWHNAVASTPYDPDSAKKLLAEAKADGYDGRISYLGYNDPASQQIALAFQSLLEAVGFSVEIAQATSQTDLLDRMYSSHDYDLGEWGYNVLDESPFVRMYGNFHSQSPSNILGYKSIEMDALLQRVQSAATENDRRHVIASIQELVNETVPMVPYSARKGLIAWSNDTHGITPSADGIMLFGKAWRSGSTNP